MSRSPAIDLLAELRERGIELAVVGERLRFRPVDAVPRELRERIARLKPELIALLRPTAPPEPPAAEIATEDEPIPEYGDGDRPTVKRCPKCRQPDFTRPRPRGTWCCARCHPYEGTPASALEWWPAVQSVVSLDALLGADRSLAGTGPCGCCGELKWWRLKSGGPWVCARCRPPQPAPEAIDTLTIGEAA